MQAQPTPMRKREQNSCLKGAAIGSKANVTERVLGKIFASLDGEVLFPHTATPNRNGVTLHTATLSAQYA